MFWHVVKKANNNLNASHLAVKKLCGCKPKEIPTSQQLVGYTPADVINTQRPQSADFERGVSFQIQTQTHL